MRPARCSGVLCHVTSLPSPWGIGDLGPDALRFVDFLYESKQSRWQILPLNPTDATQGDSPYSSDSAFAIDPLLISPERLIESGLVSRADVASAAPFPDDHVNYAAVRQHRHTLLAKAWARLSCRPDSQAFEQFCNENQFWLDDYALFRALKQAHKSKPWYKWPKDLLDRKSTALKEAANVLSEDVRRTKTYQYLLFHQWQQVRRYCNEKHIRVIGDLPYYVAYDSADVWAHPALWKLDRHKRPTHVAGTPPDYFCSEGQLWGMPVYDWTANEKADYTWWIHRIEWNLKCFDMVRIDHFRGFLGTWQVPAKARTARTGHWVHHPQDKLMEALRRRQSYLPIIAEDLGLITPDVREFICKYELPGMRLLQVCFGPQLPGDWHAPHNHPRNCLVYSGTHDNNTTRGWFETEATASERQWLFKYLGHRCSVANVSWELIRLAMMSVADTAIVPLQDILSLGAAARMNRPGTAHGNWQWRFKWKAITPQITRQLAETTTLFNRAE